MTPAPPTPALIGILTVSDRASRGEYADEGGPAIRDYLREVLANPWEPRERIVADDLDTIAAAIRDLATEGSSQFLITEPARAATTVLARCAPLDRSGCALQEPERARVGSNDDVVCTWVSTVGRGRLAGTCDRNTFHNGPGVGTALSEFDNRRYATNLFRWLARR